MGEAPLCSITTHVELPVTSQTKHAVIYVANGIGDPRNHISEKYSPRSDLVHVLRAQSTTRVGSDRLVQALDL